MIVNNLSNYAKNYKYIVARRLDDVENGSDLWFWGAWDELEEATQAASEIGGIVMEREDIENA